MTFCALVVFPILIGVYFCIYLAKTKKAQNEKLRISAKHFSKLPIVPEPPCGPSEEEKKTAQNHTPAPNHTT